MIRYDVLWHDLVRDLNEARVRYASNAEELDKMNAKDLATSNRYVSMFIDGMLMKTQKEFDYMKERDDEVEGSAVILLQDMLQELKKLNKGKEDEENGVLDDHGDGFGDDADNQGNAERDQPVSAGTRG